jgi:hypothetical protein
VVTVLRPGCGWREQGDAPGCAFSEVRRPVATAVAADPGVIMIEVGGAGVRPAGARRPSFSGRRSRPDRPNHQCAIAPLFGPPAGAVSAWYTR